MIRHIVLIKFKDGYSEETLAEVARGLDALPEQIPEIISYQHGKDLRAVDGTFDYAVTGEFASTEDCLTYLVHPAHQAVGGKMVELIADAAQVQFSC